MDQPVVDGPDRVRQILREAGISTDVTRLNSSARTAAEAASAIGCTVAQIAKSLIFKGVDSGEHVLVIACGANRVDEARIASTIGERIVKADAAYVRERTGFAIGGVAPIGHTLPPRNVLIDADLAELDPIWAAAGHPHAVFRTHFAELLRLTSGVIAQIA